MLASLVLVALPLLALGGSAHDETMKPRSTFAELGKRQMVAGYDYVISMTFSAQCSINQLNSAVGPYVTTSPKSMATVRVIDSVNQPTCVAGPCTNFFYSWVPAQGAWLVNARIDQTFDGVPAGCCTGYAFAAFYLAPDGWASKAPGDGVQLSCSDTAKDSTGKSCAPVFVNLGGAGFFNKCVYTGIPPLSLTDIPVRLEGVGLRELSFVCFNGQSRTPKAEDAALRRSAVRSYTAATALVDAIAASVTLA
ncbi:uncharacterized protein L969DRAFT_95456 [Mixia osmundae IAM 14324]|uniref:uncharacterized protein n=1 Tax=Mixia osmundae (strain CBS 9802 / IAM 14324 / JCM 22182 / KY 12970) TaxID=764103 RepID=UPI0004A5599B|nr:uncharacterized protein L969DRAFT_95456 [Mixia osmundae IAM 14324]KEI38377.1 hypothetical protein L969DRAFT_95456 [Mixia osmundae IAM 14324]